MSSIFKLALESDGEEPIIDPEAVNDEEEVEEQAEEVEVEAAQPDVTTGEDDDEEEGEVEVTADSIANAEKELVNAVNNYANARADAARTVETAEYLEDLADTVREIDEINPTDRALIQTNMNMATAGTDADATEIAPGMETLMTGALAAESIMDKVTDIVNKTKEMFTRVIDSVVKYLKANIKVLNTSVERMKKALDKIENAEVAKKETITFEYGGRFKKSNGEAVANSAEYIKEATSSFDSVTKAIKAAGNTVMVEKAISTYASGTVGSGTDDLPTVAVTEGNRYVDAIQKSFKGVTKGTKGGLDTYTLKPNIGTSYVELGFWRVPGSVMGGANFVKYNAGKTKGSVEMDVMDVAKLKTAINKLITMVEQAKTTLKDTQNRINASKKIIDLRGSKINRKKAKLTGSYKIVSGLMMTYTDAQAQLGKLFNDLSKGAVQFAEAQAAAYE